MNLDQFINNDLLIICPTKIKSRILDQYCDQLLSFKFMSKEEFKNHYYYSYDQRSIIYLMEKYHIHMDVAKTYLKNLYAIDIKKEYKNKKLAFLKEIKQELIKNDLLEFDPLFQTYLKTKKIIVIGYPLLEKYEEEMFFHATILKQDINKINTSVVACQTMEDEILFVISNILKLIKNKVSLNQIYLTNIDDEYLYSIKKMFSYFHIPIHLDMKESIYGTKMTKEYLKNRKLPKLKTNLTSKLIEVVNQLVDLEDSKYYDDFLKEKLKHTYLSVPTMKQEIQIIDLEEAQIGEDEYLFLLGFNQENIPKIYKDEDFITDRMKDEISLYTTKEKNKRSRESIKRILSNVKNLYISYKEKSNFNSYLPSSLIKELDLEVISYDSNQIYPCHFYNQLKLGEYLDLYHKYGEENKNLKKLNSYYSIDYQKYQNQFTKIDPSILKRYFNGSLKLSYTSLNSYQLCAFQYYIRYILKLDPFSNTFSILIGNLFHDIFSSMYLENFDFDQCFNYVIKKHEFSNKEKFFIKNLKEELRQEILLIKDLEMLSSYQNVLTEKEIVVKRQRELPVFFTGKIDKIMYHKEVDDTYFSVIDYKTGNFNANISSMKYGLNMQLPLYLYLLTHTKEFPSPIFTGMYYQKVLYPNLKWQKDKNIEEMKKNRLKLQGYSTNCKDRLYTFDRSYEKSEMIRGMKMNKDGSFSKNSKVLSDDEIYQMLKYTEQIIDSCSDHILKGDFKINPKVLEKQSACHFCHFKDLCYVVNQDFVHLEKQENLEFLEIGGESHG